MISNNHELKDEKKVNLLLIQTPNKTVDCRIVRWFHLGVICYEIL